jgi:hypothetical protein
MKLGVLKMKLDAILQKPCLFLKFLLKKITNPLNQTIIILRFRKY